MKTMNSKNLLLIALTTSFLVGCDMGSNPLRAKAREVERQQQEQKAEATREQETKYGKDISKSFKESSE